MTLRDLGKIADSEFFRMHVIKIAITGTTENINRAGYVVNVDEQYLDREIERIFPFTEGQENVLGIVIKEG